MIDETHLTRRQWLVRAGTAAALCGVAPARLFAHTARTVDIHKQPGCRCCDAWAALLEKAGFVVTVTEDADIGRYKDSLGVPKALRSCHTGVSDGYVFEGHVPIDLVDRWLTKRPTALGLAVPGMPQGAPGMESSTPVPYDVVAFDRAGKSWVYAHRG